MTSHDIKRIVSLVILFAALTATSVEIAAEEGADEGEDGLHGVRHLSGECCWSFHQKRLHELKLDEILWWMQCNHIAADSIGIVKRDNIAGLEMSVMTKDELMELLGMSMVSAWRVSRCKDVADGIRKWPANHLQGDAILHQQAAAQLQQKTSPLQEGVGEDAGSNQQEQNRGRSWEDMTGKRCFGLSRVHDAARTPDHCQEQCSHHPTECGLWLYSYVEGCWIGKPRENYVCRYEEGWLGSIRLEQRAFHQPATLTKQLLDDTSTSPEAFSTTLPARNQAAIPGKPRSDTAAASASRFHFDISRFDISRRTLQQKVTLPEMESRSEEMRIDSSDGIAYPLGTQFTCCASTKVQILTQRVLLESFLHIYGVEDGEKRWATSKTEKNAAGSFYHAEDMRDDSYATIEAEGGATRELEEEDAPLKRTYVSEYVCARKRTYLHATELQQNFNKTAYGARECGWDHPECVRPRSRAGVQRRLAIRRPEHGALVYALSNETSYTLQLQVLSLLALLVQEYKY
jgi:hypothetical protein